MKSVTDASRKPEQCTEQTVKTSIYKTSPAIFLGNIAERKKMLSKHGFIQFLGCSMTDFMKFERF